MNIPPNTTCTNLRHPVAEDGPVKEFAGVKYIDLVCTECGRSQGLRRIRRK